MWPFLVSASSKHKKKITGTKFKELSQEPKGQNKMQERSARYPAYGKPHQMLGIINYIHVDQLCSLARGC